MFTASEDTREREHEPEKFFGKYPGLVLENEPPEDASHRGELLVEVPGILEETPDGEDQQPIQLIARPCFHPGFFFIPEVGDQVWVEFVAGDINSPLWVGVWYPTDGTPLTAEGESPTEFQKVIRTPSGQLIQLDDSDGEEKTIITDEANSNIVTLDANGIKTEDANNVITMDSNGIKLEDGNNNTVTMDSNGIKLETASGAIILSSSGIRLETGNSAVEISATSVKVTDSTGGLQYVVLEPTLTWLQTHQHVGNMGAPTPVFPANLADLIAQQMAGLFRSGL